MMERRPEISSLPEDARSLQASFNTSRSREGVSVLLAASKELRVLSDEPAVIRVVNHARAPRNVVKAEIVVTDVAGGLNVIVRASSSVRYIVGAGQNRVRQLIESIIEMLSDR